MRLRVIDYAASRGGVRRLSGEVLRALVRSHSDLELELVSHGPAIERYRRLMSELKVVLKVADILPRGYGRNIGDRNILGVKGTWRLWRFAEGLGFRYRPKWHFDLPRAALDNCDIAWLPFVQGHRLPASQRTSHIVGTSHDIIHLQFSGIIGQQYQVEESVSMARWISSDARIVTDSGAVATVMSEMFHTSRQRFSVIPLSIEHACAWRDLTPPVDYEWAQRPYLIFPANPSLHKNHEVLFRGLASWAMRRPLVLVGPDILDRSLDRVQRLYAEAESLGFRLGTSLIILGRIEERTLGALIANAWALVFPTLAEGFGFPPLEALACGVPVVCSDIPVMRENLGRAGEAVLWFDAQDPVSLAAVLRELDTRYEAVKAAAMNQRSAFTRRTWQEVAEDYWNVFSLASGIPNTEKVTRRIVGTETPLG